MLLFTNDGELAAKLLAPRSHVEKTYHAKFKGHVSMEEVEKLRKGVKIDDGRVTLPAEIDVLKRTREHTWLVMSIREGRSRQIHRMAEALNHQVIKLARVAFAGLTYYNLKIGEWRHLTPAEVHDLREAAGLTGRMVDVEPALAEGTARVKPRPERRRRTRKR